MQTVQANRQGWSKRGIKANEHTRFIKSHTRCVSPCDFINLSKPENSLYHNRHKMLNVHLFCFKCIRQSTETWMSLHLATLKGITHCLN